MGRESRGWWVAALLATVMTPSCAQPEAEPGTIAFTNVTVLPMDRPGVVENQTVVVVDGEIREVGAADEVQVGAGATEIDGTGRFLMPGLAEMHAHVPPGENPPREDVEDILFLYVANGVTTIRGMLGSAYQIPLAEEIRRGEVLGPTFYVGAPSINGTSAPDPESAERLIREHAQAGYDLQKIHPGVSLESWDRMVAVAEEVGLTFGPGRGAPRPRKPLPGTRRGDDAGRRHRVGRERPSSAPGSGQFARPDR